MELITNPDSIKEPGSVLPYTITVPEITACFNVYTISEKIIKRIHGISYHENNHISFDDLVYLQIPHWNFQHEIVIGELVVNKKIYPQILRCMLRLFNACYPIEKMFLIDNYDANDERSMADNNSSAFNYRCIAGTSKLSKHSLGLAIDINPLYNPYLTTINQKPVVLPKESTPYINRECCHPYMIHANDVCVRTFKKEGFEWGGDWSKTKDYQHFDISISC